MKVLVVGATGEVGTAVSESLSQSHEVVKASRSSAMSIDIEDLDSTRNLLQAVGHIDALVVCAGTVPFKHLSGLTGEDLVRGFHAKVLSQIHLALESIPWIRDGGSITLTSGVLARESRTTGSVGAMANGALEAFVRSAALEMPRGIRLNIVSPNVIEGSASLENLFHGSAWVSRDVLCATYVLAVEGQHNAHVFCC